MSTARISLDSPVFAGRLRSFSRRPSYDAYERRAVSVRPRVVSDIRPAQPGKLSAQSVKNQSTPAAAASPALPARTRPSLVLKRDGLKFPEPPSPPAEVEVRRFKPGGWHKKMLTGLAVVLFLLGIGVAIDGLLANRAVEAQVQNLQTEGSGSGDENAGAVPGDGDKTDVDGYRTAPDLPRVLTIPKIGVKARVLGMGVDKQGNLAAPANIHDTGWYKASAKPGERGAMLIDGHVHGPTQPGVFIDLDALQPGDEIAIERGDGQRFRYKMVRSERYPADQVDMGAALMPVTPGKPGLNLITCTGELDRQTNHYKDRLVVFAEQL